MEQEVLARLDQQMTVIIRSTRGSEDNWLRNVVSRLTGSQNHMMIANTEVIPEGNNRLTQAPGGDNDIVGIQAVEQSRGRIRWDEDAPASLIRIDLSVSNYMHTFLQVLSDPYIEYRGQITYLQMYNTTHVTGSPQSHRVAVRSAGPGEFLMIPRMVVLDCMNLKRTMECTMPSLSLYPAMDLIYELSKYVAEIMNAKIVLAFPSRFKSSEIKLAWHSTS